MVMVGMRRRVSGKAWFLEEALSLDEMKLRWVVMARHAGEARKGRKNIWGANKTL